MTHVLLVIQSGDANYEYVYIILCIVSQVLWVAVIIYQHSNVINVQQHPLTCSSMYKCFSLAYLAKTLNFDGGVQHQLARFFIYRTFYQFLKNRTLILAARPLNCGHAFLFLFYSSKVQWFLNIAWGIILFFKLYGFRV